MTAFDTPVFADPAPADEPYVKQPGQWRRRGKDGPPMVTSPDPDELVKTGDRKGMPKYVTYSRPSGRGKLIENTHNLQKWGERMAIYGAVLDPGLIAQVGSIPHDVDSKEWKSAMDKLVVQLKDRAQANLSSERGQHAHSLTEDVDEGRSWLDRALAGEELGISQAAQTALVEAWRRMLAVHGFEILAVEAAVVCDSLRMAGTLDRIVRLTRDITFWTADGERITIAAGTVIVLDIKSGKLRTDKQGRVQYWHSYGVQLAPYALGVPYDVDAETRGEWPFEISTEWAIIAHLDVLGAIEEDEARCTLVLCDLAKGIEAAQLCTDAAAWAADDRVFTSPLHNPDMTVAVPVAQPEATVICGTYDAVGQCHLPKGHTGPHSDPFHSDAFLEDDLIESRSPLTAHLESLAAAHDDDAMGPHGDDVVQQARASARCHRCGVDLGQLAEWQEPVCDSCYVAITAPVAPRTVEQLRHRINLLASGDQERLWYAWQQRGLPSLAAGAPEPSAADLGAIAALIDEHEPFADVVPLPVKQQPEPAPARARLAPRTAIVVDEGTAVTPDAMAFLGRRRSRLSEAHQEWWADRVQEAAEAERSIALVEQPSERRYWIALALVTLAEADCLDDDTVRALLASVLSDPTAFLPIVPVGRGLGFLDATTAPKFAQLADDLIAGLVAAVVDPDDGVIRLHFAATTH